MQDHLPDMSGLSPPPQANFEEWLDQRIEAITLWLEARTPAHTKELAELDSWLRELLHWYHGYLAALCAVRDSARRRPGSLH